MSANLASVLLKYQECQKGTSIRGISELLDAVRRKCPTARLDCGDELVGLLLGFTLPTEEEEGSKSMIVRDRRVEEMKEGLAEARGRLVADPEFVRSALGLLRTLSAGDVRRVGRIVARFRPKLLQQYSLEKKTKT